MKEQIEFTFNELGAKAVAHIKDGEIDKIVLKERIPRRFYYSFFNDAIESFLEQYPQYR